MQLFNSCTGKICGLPGCGKPCYIEQNGTIHNYCCKTHKEANSLKVMLARMTQPQMVPFPVPIEQTIPSMVETISSPFAQSAVSGVTTSTSNYYTMSTHCISHAVYNVVFGDYDVVLF